MSSTEFEAEYTPLDDHTHRYRVRRGGEPLGFASALRLWQGDEAFRRWFADLLRDSPFEAYRWETPPVTRTAVSRDFEFVLVDSPWLTGPVDPTAFSSYFSAGDIDAGVVVFTNLGGDAELVVPSPRAPAGVYAHLAAFVRGAPEAQVDALWRVIGRTVLQSLGERPRWLSTAGGGVAWLHVRLDLHPKYYVYAPYRIFN